MLSFLIHKNIRNRSNKKWWLRGWALRFFNLVSAVVHGPMHVLHPTIHIALHAVCKRDTCGHRQIKYTCVYTRICVFIMSVYVSCYVYIHVAINRFLWVDKGMRLLNLQIINVINSVHANYFLLGPRHFRIILFLCVRLCFIDDSCFGRLDQKWSTVVWYIYLVIAFISLLWCDCRFRLSNALVLIPLFVVAPLSTSIHPMAWALTVQDR